MFTNQYIKYKNYCFSNTRYDVCVYLRDTTNAERSAYVYRAYRTDIGACMQYAITGDITATKKIGYTSDMGGVCFGTGNTPATKSDYCLESPIVSGISVAKTSLKKMELGNGKYVFAHPFVVTNTSGADINIYEVGLVCYLPMVCSSGVSMTADDNCYPYLFDRVVLTEPITIPAGESKLVEYRVIFNQTMNVEGIEVGA